MNFNTQRPVNIVLLGVGGTGGHVAPHLYRLAYAIQRPCSITLVDGDVVEQKNLVRQNFCFADLGENKARAMAERYATAFGMEVSYIPSYLEDDAQLLELLLPHATYRRRRQRSSEELQKITELPILIGAVDNDSSRQMCHRVFERMQELVYIDSGNGEYSGQVVCGVRAGNRTFFRPAGKVFPSILTQQDKFPSQLSCAEAAVSAPQSMAANITAAAIVVDFVYNIVTRGRLTTKYTTFSSSSINVRPETTKRNTQKRRSAA